MSCFAFQLRAAASAVLCLPLEGPAVEREQTGAAPGLLLEKGSCQRAGHAQYLEYTSYLLQAGVAFPQVKLKLLLRPYPPPICAD